MDVYLNFLEMVYYYSSASVAILMINIWYHQMHDRIKNDKRCNCRYFINEYIVLAKRKWKKEYISIEAAISHFTSLNLELMNIMLLKNKKTKISCNKFFKR